MAGEDERQDAGYFPPERPTGPFRKWGAPAIGLIVVAALAATSLVLARRYMASRPLDLVPITDAMADHIQDLLEMSRLPRDAVKRYDPVVRNTADSTWHAYTYDVGVPPHMNAREVVATLKQGMAMQNVSMEESEGVERRWREVRFFMLGREFATVRVRGGAERYDMVAACDRLAERVGRALKGLPEVAQVLEIEQETVQDGPAKWRRHAVRAYLSETVGAEAVRKALAETVNAPIDGETPAFSASPRENALEAIWRNRPVVRIDLAHLQKQFAPEKRPFYEDPLRLWETDPLFFRSLYGFDLADPGFPLANVSGNPPSAPHDKPDAATEGASAPSEANPRAAIIVDDGGYGGLVTEAILTMDPGLTLAILPGTTYATETAERANALGFQVIVHMPLESGNGDALFPGELKTTMTESDMDEGVARALADIPAAAGMNNHTGSKFAADEKAMKRFLAALKKRNLYFVDSRTRADTVGLSVAKALGVPAAERAVFLDNEAEADYIRGQFAELLSEAREKGAAIGICHFRSTTAALLPEMIRELKEKGVDLVHASELVQ